MAQPKLQGVAVAWFTRDDYPRVRELSVDGDGMQDTFEQFVAVAEQRIKDAEKRGMAIEKVIVTPADLMAFARANNCQINTGVRAQVAAILLAKRHQEGEPQQ